MNKLEPKEELVCGQRILFISCPSMLSVVRYAQKENRSFIITSVHKEEILGSQQYVVYEFKCNSSYA